MFEKLRSHKRFTVGTTLLIGISLLTLGHYDNPPNGFTGAPGESTCGECHSLNGGMQNGSILINGFPAVAMANQTYPLTVTVANPNGIADVAGFQMVILNDANGNAGTMTNAGPNSTVTISGGRSYHEHNPAQDFPMSNIVQWTVDWTAPVGSGQVTYYAAGNVANGSGTDNGDLIVTSTGSGTLMTPLMVSISGTQNVSCFGGMDGSVTALAEFGNPGYSYSWSNGGSGATLTGLGIGTYTVTVTDNAGAMATASAQITQPPVFQIVSETITNVSCNGGSDGQIMLNLDGGVPPYSGAIGDTYTQSNLAAGDYEVTVMDANGCIITGEYTITEPEELNLFINTIIEPECAGEATGFISVEATGGSGTLSYMWSNGETSSTIQNLEAGSYTVTVTDDNGCTVTDVVDLNEPDLLIVEAIILESVSCNGAADGQILVEASGGTGEASFSWSNGAQDELLVGLDPGTYTVTATDDNGCTDVASYEITEPLQILVVVTGTETLLCTGDDDGMLIADVSGGNSPYSYAWSDGQNGMTIEGLLAGVYTVTVTDDEGCSEEVTFEIAEPEILLPNAVATPVSGPGEMDGTASAAPSGGTGGYTFLWSNGEVGEMITGLGSGVYTVTVTDENGCTAAQSVTVSGVNCTLFVSVSGTDALCFGEASGTASVTSTGAMGDVTIQWSQGGSAEALTDLAAGTYTVSVTDSEGCLATGSVTIGQPSALVLSCQVTNESEEGAGDGSILCTATGGTPLYHYLWSTGDTMSLLTDLPSGTYYLTLTDDNGCVKVDSATVTPFQCLITLNFELMDASCFGEEDGEISLTVSNAEPPYLFSWSNGADASVLTDLAAGDYSVTVVDDAQCVSVGSVTIGQPDELQVTVDSMMDDSGGSTGAIFITVSGGTAPYTYTWIRNGVAYSSSEDITGLDPAEYGIAVTDANGCILGVGTLIITITTGIDLVQEARFSIWPNPVADMLNLQSIDQTGVLEITVLAHDGRVLKAYKGASVNAIRRLRTGDLGAGLYYLLVRHERGTEVHPFVKAD